MTQPLISITEVDWTPPAAWNDTGRVWIDPRPGDWLQYRPRVCQWMHTALVLPDPPPSPEREGHYLRLMIREGDSPVVSIAEIPAGDWIYYQHTVYRDRCHAAPREIPAPPT